MWLYAAVAVILGFLIAIARMNGKASVLTTVTNERVPSSMRATTLSVMSTIGSLVATAVNSVIGRVTDVSPRSAALMLAAGLLVIGLGWIPMLRER